MRLPLIFVACLAVSNAIAQAPRIKWRPMDFPPQTMVKAELDGKTVKLGEIRYFYKFVKAQGWSCTFDNAGGPRSGPSTLRCHVPRQAKPTDFYVEYLPEQNELTVVDDTGEHMSDIYEVYGPKPETRG
ncbi:hypothetical protein BoBH3_19525 [Bosea sp. BH3]|nr:hypothetical protein [Bosea sp. BH3]